MNRLHLKAVIFSILAYFCCGVINVIVSKVLIDVDSVVIFYMMMLFSQIALLPLILRDGKAFFKIQ